MITSSVTLVTKALGKIVKILFDVFILYTIASSPKTGYDVQKYLSRLFGGKILFRQTRVFLQGSKVVFDPKSIGKLANDLSLKFNVPVEITIELEKISDEEITENNFNFPAKKALPIVGTD